MSYFIKTWVKPKLPDNIKMEKLKKNPFQRLCWLRIQANQSLGDVSDATGFSVSDISAFEGNRKLIAVDYVRSFSIYLGCARSPLTLLVHKLNLIFLYKNLASFVSAPQEHKDAFNALDFESKVKIARTYSFGAILHDLQSEG